MTKIKDLYISFSTRILILSILLVFGIIMSVAFFIGATETDVKNLVAHSSANIDYDVHLKQNSYYDSNVLPGDMEYIASLIDYIDVDFDYKISSTDPMNYDYTYSIEAITRVYGDNAKKKVLFERNKVLLAEKKLNVKDTDNVSIKENIKIDYNEYNMLIASFKTSYSLNSLSDVAVVLRVKATGKNDGIEKTVNVDEKAELLIPLTEQTIDVEMTKNPGYTYEIIDTSENFVVNNKSDLVLSVLCVIFTLFIGFRLIKMNVQASPRSSKYAKTLKRILREYDLIIANVNHSIDESKYEVITVTSFEELKDIHDNVGSPILFNEIHKNQKSNFIIVKDNFLYKYVLKSVDLET